MSKREEIVNSLRMLPPLPPAAQKTLPLLWNTNSNLTQIAATIQLDPGLTANLLRLANAPSMGCVRSIATVHDALVRLGASRVAQLILAASTAPQLRPATPGYDLPPGALLEHSIATALAAEEIAAETGVTAPPNTFTAGLLANIGKTVMGEYLQVDVRPLLELAYSEFIPFQEAEKRLLGIDHAEVGALLLQNWGLPEEIVHVVRWHLDPDNCDTPSLTLDLVHAGESLAKMCSIALGIDGLHYHPSTFVIERLQLTPEIVEKVMASVVEKAAELSEIFAPRF